MAQNKYDVFISYARRDYRNDKNEVIPGNPVTAIKDALAKADITYWIDEEGIKPGDEFPDEIVTNIESSRILVFISSENSNKSEYTSKEVSCAFMWHKPVIPIRLDDSAYGKRILFRIVDVDYIDYFKNPQKGLDDLVASIKSNLAEIEKREEQERLEEQKRQEDERKRQEEEQRRLEEQNKKKLQEEEERQKAMQQIIAQIREKCANLNLEESLLEHQRDSLLLEVDTSVSDEDEKKIVKSFIINSSPIRKRGEDERLALANEKEDLERQVAALRKQCEELESLNKAQDATIKKQEKKLKKKSSKDNSSQALDASEGGDADKKSRKGLLWLLWGLLALAALCAVVGYLKSSSQKYNDTAIIEESSSIPESLRDSLNLLWGQLSSIHPKLQEYIDGFNKNDPEATFRLAKCFERGDFLEGHRNMLIAGKLIHIAADQGDDKAQTSLGFYFYNGKAGYELNYDSATYWYKKAITNGSIEAKYYLAQGYASGCYQGKSKSTIRTSDALELYKQSANQGSALSQLYLGVYYYDNGRYQEAKDWLEKALTGDLSPESASKAYFMLGQLYGTNKPGIEYNQQKAFNYYQKASTTGQGYLMAWFYMGVCYENGYGTAKNLALAKECYKKAADRGHGKSKEKLSKLGN